MRLLALVYLLDFCVALKAAEVYVDSINGNDEECRSLQELLNNVSLPSTTPCKTLNSALGGIQCSRNCTSETPLLDSIVRLSDGVHTLTGCVAILGGSNVTIEAQNIGKATVHCVTVGNQARQIGSDNIQSCLTQGLTFRGINFEACGPTSPNVFLNRSTNVLFEDCSFKGNTGAPLRLQFVPSVKLLRTSFLNNKNQISGRQDNENTTLFDLFDSVTTSGGFTYFSRNTSVEITVEDCKFINNSAEADLSIDRPVLLKADGHGGGILIRITDVEEARIRVTNSLFEDNHAGVDGAGMYFSLSNISSSTIFLYNNTFKHNTATESTGGAISWNLFSLSLNNSLLLEECRFLGNSAGAGGAVSLTQYDSTVSDSLPQDKAEFIKCDFMDNRAEDEGTAVGLFSLVGVEQFGFPVTFMNCSFVGNRYPASQKSPEDASALLAFRFPVNFIGSNIFVGNEGGGISIISTRITVKGELVLQNNTAMFGGGISMRDICVIEIGPGVKLILFNNTARMSGGGISVVFPAIRYTTTIFNRLCFLQYRSPDNQDVPPHEWQDVNISLSHNTARLSGAAIYATDMQLCRWIGNVYASTGLETGTIFERLPEDIAHLSPFNYQNNEVFTSQINPNLATAPNRLYITPKIEQRVVQPGEKVSLDITAIDQVNNSREAVVALDSPNQDTILTGISAGNETFVYQVPASGVLLDITQCSSTASGQFSLNFSLPGTLGSPTKISLNLSGCHPGYTLSKDSCTCLCDTDDNNIIRCDSASRYLFLQSGVWGGFVESDGVRRLTTYYTPYNFLSCQTNGQGRLPGCLFQWDNIDAQCRTGRLGPLCGKCIEGYGVTLDLQKCSEGSQCTLGLSLFIILCFLVVLLSFLILFFNIGLPNALKGLLFYVQVVGLVYRPFLSLQLTPESDDSINPLSVLVNLMGFSLPIPLCISTGLQAQHVALLGYISPILALVTVLTYAICARFIKVLSNRSSLSGITLLFLFIYKYVADTSFTLINCSATDHGLVFTYNGSVSCTSLELGFVVIFALALVIVFVLPAPFATGYICLKRPQRFQQYADVLTHGLRKKHRWFGGWDIGRRLPFIFFGFIAVQPSIVLMLMIVGAVTILMVHLLVQPYEKRHVNVIESLILLNLVVVGVITLNPNVYKVPQWLTAIVLLCPFIYGLFYVVGKTVYYIYLRYFNKSTEEKQTMEKVIETVGKKWTRTARTGIDLVRMRARSESINTERTSNSTARTTTTSTRNTASNASSHIDPMQLEEFSELREAMLDSEYK